MNAVETRRAARCANFERWSDPLPPNDWSPPQKSQERAWPELSIWTAALSDPPPGIEPKSGFYLYGPPGSGKTYLAALTADTLRRLQIPTLFVKAKHALDHLKKFETPGHVDLWRERLRLVDVLVLDDLGAHQAKPYVIEELVDVFDYRHDFEMPTLITSNLDGPGIIDVIGGRAADRLMGMCEPIEVAGESLR